MIKLDVRDIPTWKIITCIVQHLSVTDYVCQTDAQILFIVFRQLSHENMLHPYFTKWVQARGRKQEWSFFLLPRWHHAPTQSGHWQDRKQLCTKELQDLVDKWRVVRACLPYFLVPLMISTKGEPLHSLYLVLSC